MNYIIDANNLAGSLGILKNDDFDKDLIDLIRDWLGEKQKQVILVFDSLDPIGDKYSEGFLTVVYSPRDSYYKTADDTIIEIFENWSSLGGGLVDVNIGIIEKIKKNDLVFVSNDIDLKERVAELKEEIDENIRIISNEEFIALLEKREMLEDLAEEDDRGLSDDEVEDINDELLEIWR